MANQVLLDAVNQAIKALEEVKRELERVETTPQAAEPEIPAPEAAPTEAKEESRIETAPVAPQPEPQPEPEPERLVPQTTQMMAKAAKLASAVCQQWKFQDEVGNVIDASLLEYSAGEQDNAGTVDPDDPESYYIVSPDGAIGLTENDGENVEWLFLPLHRTVASLPKKLKRGEPWPEAITLPTPQPAPTAPQPAASQPFASPTAGSICPNCGKPVAPGSKFCMRCGTPMQAAAPAPAQTAPQGAFCLSCGAPLKPGDKFCMSCGTKV